VIRRSILGLLGCALLMSVCARATLGEPTEDAAWQPIQVGDMSGFIVPDDVAKSLGLSIQDIPTEMNAATYYLQAINALPVMADASRESYDLALAGPWGPEIGEFYPWFQKTEPVRKLLRKGVSMDHCEFPFIVNNPGNKLLMGMLLPHLSQMRNFARLCVIEGHLYEGQGKLKGALESYLLPMRLGEHVSQGPTLIAGLVGIAAQRMGQDAMAECLARHSIPATTLEWLAGELARSDRLLPDRTRWVEGERAMGLQIVDMPVGEVMPLLHGGSSRHSKVLEAVSASRAFRIIWPDRAMKKDFNDFYDNAETLAQKPTWEMAKTLRQRGEGHQLPEGVKDWNILAALLLPALRRAHLRFVGSVCDHDALTINVALRRYRIAKGRYPETLADLQPKFLAELPPDPFSGQPFKYRREKEEWLLYSVGPDGDDDKGTGTGRLEDEGDVVYRSVTQEN